jgi:hypothetical protein
MASPSLPKFHPISPKVVSHRNLGLFRLAIGYRRFPVPTIRVSLIFSFVIPYFSGFGGKATARGEQGAIPGGGPEGQN